MPEILTEADINQVRTSFRRFSAETVEAILQFRQTRDEKVVPTVVLGVIERYMPAESTVQLAQLDDNTRLIEDLGIDSLTMLELVLSIEEALGVRIENEELVNIRTLGQVKVFVATKSTQSPSRNGTGAHRSIRIPREQILLSLPHKPPFLFVDRAEIIDKTIHAEYRVSGDEFFLDGHFPGNPIFPASIVFEALGQVACLWLVLQEDPALLPYLESKELLFGSMESAQFFRKIKPGDVLNIEVTSKNVHAPLAIFNGKVTVSNEKVATVEELSIFMGEEKSTPSEEESIAAPVDEAALPKL